MAVVYWHMCLCVHQPMKTRGQDGVSFLRCLFCVCACEFLCTHTHVEVRGGCYSRSLPCLCDGASHWIQDLHLARLPGQHTLGPHSRCRGDRHAYHTLLFHMVVFVKQPMSPFSCHLWIVVSLLSWNSRMADQRALEVSLLPTPAWWFPMFAITPMVLGIEFRLPCLWQAFYQPSPLPSPILLLSKWPSKCTMVK